MQKMMRLGILVASVMAVLGWQGVRAQGQPPAGQPPAGPAGGGSAGAGSDPTKPARLTITTG